MVEVIRKAIAKNKLTIARDRVTLKLRPGIPAELEQALVACARRITPLVRGTFQCTMRGRFKRHPNGALLIYLSGGGVRGQKFHITCSVDEVAVKADCVHDDE